MNWREVKRQRVVKKEKLEGDMKEISIKAKKKGSKKANKKKKKVKQEVWRCRSVKVKYGRNE